MMGAVVRLRDLGGGEPNDDLTWALFEEEPDDAGQEQASEDHRDDRSTPRDHASSESD
jgi:hypothetical protein